MIRNHTVICHKTCVCKYLAFIIYAFLQSWLQGLKAAHGQDTPGAMCPSTHPFPSSRAHSTGTQHLESLHSPFSMHQQPETKGVCEGGALFCSLHCKKSPGFGAISTLVVWEEHGRDVPAPQPTCGPQGGHSPCKPQASSSTVFPFTALTLAQPLARSQQRSGLWGAPDMRSADKGYACAGKRCQGLAQHHSTALQGCQPAPHHST